MASTCLLVSSGRLVSFADEIVAVAVAVNDHVNVNVNVNVNVIRFGGGAQIWDSRATRPFGARAPRCRRGRRPRSL
jgi:hypothetical protein